MSEFHRRRRLKATFSMLKTQLDSEIAHATVDFMADYFRIQADESIAELDKCLLLAAHVTSVAHTILGWEPEGIDRRMVAIAALERAGIRDDQS